MKSFSTRFRTVKRLQSFVEDHNLTNKKSVVVQVLTPSQKIRSLIDVMDFLSKNFHHDNIFGTFTTSTLLNASVSNELIVTFIDLGDVEFEIGYKESIFELNVSDDSFYMLYATDITKSAIKTKLSKKSLLVASLYNRSVIYKGSVVSVGLVYLRIKRDFDIDIKVIDSVVPIGRELSVESSKKNELKSISGFTPKKLFKHYLSDRLALDMQESSKSFTILKKSLFGYKSSLIISESEDSVFVDYDVKDGDVVRLGFANSSSFYDRYEEITSSLNKNFSDLMLVISSTAREEFLRKNGFDYDDAVGCFSNSEFVAYGGVFRELSHSIVIINMNKTSTNKLKTKRYSSIKSKAHNLLELDALANIADISANELASLNASLEKRVKKEVENNLKKDAILIHRSRLAQMGEMISLIAHQWKQPLSAISATSSGLHIKIELDMYDKEFFIKSLSKIEEFVKHLSTTIDDFSNFFKPSKIKKEFFIEEAVTKALSIASYSLSKNSIDIVLDIDKNIKIFTYKNELIQVLLNIIKNAENILMKRAVLEPFVKIKVYHDDDKNIIEIIDNGGGIDDSIIDKIFEPYFSTKATDKSTGLGLYMSRFIVNESLGGELKVKNSEDGAIFSIILV